MANIMDGTIKMPGIPRQIQNSRDIYVTEKHNLLSDCIYYSPELTAVHSSQTRNLPELVAVHSSQTRNLPELATVHSSKTSDLPELATVHSSKTSDTLSLRDLRYHLVRVEDPDLVVLGPHHQLVYVILVVVQ